MGGTTPPYNTMTKTKKQRMDAYKKKHSALNATVGGLTTVGLVVAGNKLGNKIAKSIHAKSLARKATKIR